LKLKTCAKTNINAQLSERSMKWDLRFGVGGGGGSSAWVAAGMKGR